MTTKENLTEIIIEHDKRDYESICNVLYLNGVDTILEEDEQIIIYVPESVSERILEDLNTIEYHTLPDIHTSSFENKDWNEEWEKSIQLVNIKNKIIIYPSWKKKEVTKFKNKILIQIDPKMSFGTGHNETTQVVLEMMCDYIKPSDKFMRDFGCGTGILAIAGVKLGVNKCVAIDIDEDSIADAKENFANNKVLAKINCYRSSINYVKESGFDVICANIISGTILDNMMQIKNRLKSKGKLFLSGVLASEKKKVLQSLEDYGFEVLDVRKKNEWLGIYSKIKK